MLKAKVRDVGFQDFGLHFVESTGLDRLDSVLRHSERLGRLLQAASQFVTSPLAPRSNGNPADRVLNMGSAGRRRPT
jgi:hypothetical protein